MQAWQQTDQGKELTDLVQPMSGDLSDSQWEMVGGAVKNGYPLAFELQREMREELDQTTQGKSKADIDSQAINRFLASLDLSRVSYQLIDNLVVDQAKNGRQRYFPLVYAAKINLSDHQFQLLRAARTDVQALDETQPHLYRPMIQQLIKQGYFAKYRSLDHVVPPAQRFDQI